MNESKNSLSRPPGWKPVYGSFEKPVYKPTENARFRHMIESLSVVKKLTDFNVKIPYCGTNQDHISIHAYTVDNGNKRNLIVDVYISNFKEWTPEPKGGYNYPENALVENGPYYMALADDLASVFNIFGNKYSLVEYDKQEDLAIYSAEYSFNSIDL